MTAPRVSGAPRRQRTSRRPWVAAAVLVPALVLAGCSSEGGPTPATAEGKGGQVAQIEPIERSPG